MNTKDETANANQDYRPLRNFPVIFGPGQTAKTINIRILNDRVFEKSEVFSIIMTTRDSGVTKIAPNVARVTIIDDDGK